tara:strand:+ start:1133 stop:1237 length:105 start_codon:yes stop_codon:yes gene_type:complete
VITRFNDKDLPTNQISYGGVDLGAGAFDLDNFKS